MNSSDLPIESAEVSAAGHAPRRTASKDHLRTQGGLLTVVGTGIADYESSDPLVFWSLHTSKPYLIDLREFATGRQLKGVRGGSFEGRRELIEQIAPAFKTRHSMAVPSTIETIKTGLRNWWRLFDAIEAEEQAGLQPGDVVKRLTSTLDLGALHGSRAVQSGMSKNDFHSFVVLADITRLALGVKRPLHWSSPERQDRGVVAVPTHENIKAIYHGLKADWHSALDRWALCNGLVAGPDQGGYVAGMSPDAVAFKNELSRAVAKGEPQAVERAELRLSSKVDAELILAKGLELWRAAESRLGHVDLVRQDLIDSGKPLGFTIENVNISEVAEALYPNGVDIRAAFFTCLAVGGLNASVLLDLRLDLTQGMEGPEGLIGSDACDDARREWVLRRCPFIVQSPIGGEYYIEGWKERAKAWISRTYMWKQHLTPGPILVELVIRTWPLRMALHRRLLAASDALTSAIEGNACDDALNELRKNVLELTDAVRSPWLFRGMHILTWLSPGNYAGTEAAGNTRSYLQDVVNRVNKDRLAHGRPEIEPMEPKRFRDAYATWALDYSGGEVLAVMVALDHRRISTTDIYLRNTVVRARVAEKHRNFSKALFAALASGNVDPTLVAAETRFVDADEEVRSRMALRLVEYRTVLKSRYGIGCRDPHHPSDLAAPDFEADGITLCSTHRCTLCPQNAIITPDAYPGLMLRQAELEIREEHMPMASFVLSSFDAELQNVRSALLPLRKADPDRLIAVIQLHKQEIKDGKRRVPGFSIKPT